MNHDATVLRAMFRLASRQKTVHEREIRESAGVSRPTVCASLRRLQAAGLAEIRPAGSTRLTLGGLAVATALRAARKPRKRSWASYASRAA